MDYQRINIKLSVNRRKKNPISLIINVVDDNTFDYIEVDDIDLFVKPSKGNTRDRNDCNNKKREKILSILPTLTTTNNLKYKNFLKDDRWKFVYDKFMDMMQSIIDKEGKEYNNLELVHKAGRGHNYDFQVLFYKDGNIIHTLEQMEFKNGCKNITTKVPQHLSLPVSSEYGNFIQKIGLYDEFFYEEYLQKVIKCYNAKNIILPPLLSLADYRKLVKSVDAKIHPLFHMMKINESKVKTEKSKLVDESIDMYLRQVHKDTIDFDRIQKKLNASQGNKTYVLWDSKNFNVDYIKKDELNLNKKFDLKYGRNRLANTLILHTENPRKSWEFLLRWRNHKGVLNPAWQIKLKFK